MKALNGSSSRTVRTIFTVARPAHAPEVHHGPRRPLRGAQRPDEAPIAPYASTHRGGESGVTYTRGAYSAAIFASSRKPLFQEMRRNAAAST